MTAYQSPCVGTGTLRDSLGSTAHKNRGDQRDLDTSDHYARKKTAGPNRMVPNAAYKIAWYTM